MNTNGAVDFTGACGEGGGGRGEGGGGRGGGVMNFDLDTYARSSRTNNLDTSGEKDF